MLTLTINKPYDFAASVRDHGWISLVPCRWLDEQQALQRVEQLSTGRVVLLHLTGQERARTVQIEVQINEAVTAQEATELEDKLRWMLKLDENFDEFYRQAAQDISYHHRLKSGRGRLLRSSTLFEDVIKTICTTNITWSQTVSMVSRIVTHLGDPLPQNPKLHAFPTPAQIAAADDLWFQDTIRLGYRNAYVLQLAREVATGRRDLEGLKDADLSTKDLKKALKDIKGIGDYAANTLLMLLGHYHLLAVDSEFRQRVTAKYFPNQQVSDKTLSEIYEAWGDWRYLAYWFDDFLEEAK